MLNSVQVLNAIKTESLMRSLTLIAITTLFATLGFSQGAATDNNNTNPTTSIFVARTGLRTDAPHVETYRYVEFFQLRGNWIYPDVGVIDFGHGNYRELFVGAGRTLHDGKKLMVAHEIYFVQATGAAAKSARYIQPWTLAQVRFTSKFKNETVYFPYLPLNTSARIQHVLERSKFEYTVSKTWKFGAGYAGYKFAGTPWQNRPFLTTTVSTPAGSFELWLQKMPGGGQVQFRYLLAHVGK